MTDQFRTNRNEILKRFGPRPALGAAEVSCAACNELFRAGDHTTLITLGPGTDPEARERCRDERPYNAIAVEVHWACATGFEDDPVGFER